MTVYNLNRVMNNVDMRDVQHELCDAIGPTLSYPKFILT